MRSSHDLAQTFLAALTQMRHMTAKALTGDDFVTGFVSVKEIEFQSYLREIGAWERRFLGPAMLALICWGCCWITLYPFGVTSHKYIPQITRLKNSNKKPVQALVFFFVWKREGRLNALLEFASTSIDFNLVANFHSQQQ